MRKLLGSLEQKLRSLILRQLHETSGKECGVKRIESKCNGDEDVGKNGSFHLQFVEMRVMAQ